MSDKTKPEDENPRGTPPPFTPGSERIAQRPARKRPRKKAKKKAEPTEYVVLEFAQVDHEPDDVWEGWREVDRVTAHGQEKPIIEKWATEKGVGGTFKLCPARSWKGGVRIFEQTRMTSEALS